MDTEPGHSDRMASELWRIEAVTRIAARLEGCHEHGNIAACSCAYRSAVAKTRVRVAADDKNSVFAAA